MKIKSGFMIREIMDEFIIVPVGERVVDFNGLITVNETGGFIWNLIADKDLTEEEITSAVLDEFEIDRETAQKDVKTFLSTLSEKGIAE